ncbi:MAG: hypothetical protein K5634_00050 [Sphaerochaetaceae bacterium]|nr:hypothetical protein [Sphaerochaetaceae bacterium]
MEEDARVVYADIIDLPHHQSEKHPHMSLYDRAAQFAPFAALVGYEDMITEEARLTGVKKSLTESEKDVISQKIGQISQEDRPQVSVTYFEPDRQKEGGRYVKYTGILKSVDGILRRLIFYADNGISDGRTVDIERIIDIEKRL